MSIFITFLTEHLFAEAVLRMNSTVGISVLIRLYPSKGVAANQPIMPNLRANTPAVYASSYRFEIAVAISFQ